MKKLVYITKYWETKGILHKEGEVSEKYPTMMKLTSLWSVHKPDWYDTLEEAKAHVKTKLARRIKAMKKKVATLEALNVDEMTPVE